MPTTATRRFRFKGPEMEGAVARWYARLRSTDSQLEVYRQEAQKLTAGLAGGAQVLEVAPRPGHLAIAMARSGRLHVTGLDISRTLVDIASQDAREAGVTADFRQGDAAQLPFDADRFDLIVCQAAFKNFNHPQLALSEMHRVLRPGGTAVIKDMSHEATHESIDREVGGMSLGRVSRVTTRATLEMLRRRAYSTSQFERLVAQSPFRGCEISVEGIGLEVRMKKLEAAVA